MNDTGNDLRMLAVTYTYVLYTKYLERLQHRANAYLIGIDMADLYRAPISRFHELINCFHRGFNLHLFLNSMGTYTLRSGINKQIIKPKSRFYVIR